MDPHPDFDPEPPPFHSTSDTLMSGQEQGFEKPKAFFETYTTQSKSNVESTIYRYNPRWGYIIATQMRSKTPDKNLTVPYHVLIWSGNPSGGPVGFNINFDIPENQ
jgi:hypothetical protein